MIINFNWSFIFSGQVMITWHVTNPLECHNTSVTQLSWSTKMKRRWTVLKDKITVTGLLLVNLSRSDYFFHHIVLVLSHMESNQIPFFLVSSGTDQIKPDVTHRPLDRCPHGPKYGYMAVLSQKCRLNPTNPKSNKYQILPNQRWEIRKTGIIWGTRNYDRKNLKIMIEDSNLYVR